MLLSCDRSLTTLHARQALMDSVHSLSHGSIFIAATAGPRLPTCCRVYRDGAASIRPRIPAAYNNFLPSHAVNLQLVHAKCAGIPKRRMAVRSDVGVRRKQKQLMRGYA